MKEQRFIKRFLALFLAACLLVSLSACGGGETEAETSETAEAQTDASASPAAQGADEDEYGYLATVSDLEALKDEENGWIWKIYEQDGMTYLVFVGYDTDTYENTYYLLELDETGAEVNRAELSGTSDDAYLQNYAMAGGYLWAVSYEYVMDTTEETSIPQETTDDWTSADPNETAGETETETSDDWTESNVDDDWTQSNSDLTDADSWGQETETTESSEAESAEMESETAEESETEETAETESEDDTDWIYEQDYAKEYGTGREVYTLLQYDLQGQLISNLEITALEDLEYFYVNNFTVDDAGNVYITCDTALLCYDSELNLLGEITVDTWFNDLIIMGDGRLLVSYYDEDYNEVLSYLDAETFTLGDPISLQIPTGSYSYTYYLGADGQLYASSTLGMYSVSLESGEMTLLFEWLNADVDWTNSECILPQSAEKIQLIGRDSLTSTYQMTTVNRVPVSEIPVKTELTLGVEYLSYGIRQLILSFNRSSTDYRVTVRDYSTYNTDEDTSAGMTRLKQDMATGDAPDFVYLESSYLDQLAKRGFLTDLYTLMEANPDGVQKEDLTACYRNVMEQDGCLYTITNAFYVTSLVAASSVVGDQSGWTLEEFYELAQNYTGEGQFIYNYQTREQFLSVMLSDGYNAFVNEDDGTCSFDTAEFQALLQVCLLLPEDYDDYDTYYSTMGYSYDTANMLQSGKLLVEGFGLYSAEDLRYSLDYLSDDYTLIGFPGVADSGAVMDVDYSFGICTQSQYADVAWDFIATTMTEEYAEENVYEFSTLQSYFDQQLAATMEKPYYYDENGEKVEYDDQVLTQEQVDTVRALLDSVSARYVYNEDILSIVTEEAAAYFAGQKTAEDVSALVQNRVQLYLDEQG